MDLCILAHRSLMIASRSSILAPRCTNERLGAVLKMASPKQLLVQARVRGEEMTNKRLETHPGIEHVSLFRRGEDLERHLLQREGY